MGADDYLSTMASQDNITSVINRSLPLASFSKRVVVCIISHENEISFARQLNLFTYECLNTSLALIAMLKTRVCSCNIYLILLFTSQSNKGPSVGFVEVRGAPGDPVK